MEPRNGISLVEHFSSIKDPRIDRTKRHLLTSILVIAICSIICGGETWEEMEMFGEAKENWFRTFLELPNGIPSHDTFARVFARLSPTEFQSCFVAWVQSVNEAIPAGVVAIDGKTLRHSFDKANDKSCIHMVSAWAQANGMVLGQLKVDEKSNEITAIPKLLEILELSGCIVTIDAMGCQKEIAEKIVSKDADYVLALKGNQGNMHEDVKLKFDTTDLNALKKTPSNYYSTVDGEHGRIETREYFLLSALNDLALANEWPGLKSIGMVRATREVNNKVTEENRFYLTTIYADAKKFGDSVRGHWGVENSLHWVLDVTFHEDASRIRKDNAPENVAILRHIALNLLKTDKSLKKSIKAKRLMAGWDEPYLVKILTNKGI